MILLVKILMLLVVFFTCYMVSKRLSVTSMNLVLCFFPFVFLNVFFIKSAEGKVEVIVLFIAFVSVLIGVAKMKTHDT